MRTREIEVEFYENDFKNWDTGPCKRIDTYKKDFISSKDAKVKARLIIDLPEKPIQLTESDFDEAIERIRQKGCAPSFTSLKNELFKDSNE